MKSYEDARALSVCVDQIWNCTVYLRSLDRTALGKLVYFLPVLLLS